MKQEPRRTRWDAWREISSEGPWSISTPWPAPLRPTIPPIVMIERRGRTGPDRTLPRQRGRRIDEPEAALSPERQIALLRVIHDLVEHGESQFIIATHSPIVMAYPGALIYHLSNEGIAPVAYEDTEHYRLTRDFLADRERYLRELFKDG